jgi:hypothetical protein
MQKIAPIEVATDNGKTLDVEKCARHYQALCL